jgi:hypothetical protein
MTRIRWEFQLSIEKRKPSPESRSEPSLPWGLSGRREAQLLPMRDRSWTRNAHCEHCPSSCRSPGIRPPTRYEGIPRPAEFLPGDPHPLGGLQDLGDNTPEEHRHRHPTKLGLMVEPLDQVRMQLRLVRARMWHGLVAVLSPSPALTGDGRANVRSMLYNSDWGGIALPAPPAGCFSPPMRPRPA